MLVIVECVFGGSQCYVVCCGLGAVRNELTDNHVDDHLNDHLTVA